MDILDLNSIDSTQLLNFRELVVSIYYVVTEMFVSEKV